MGILARGTCAIATSTLLCSVALAQSNSVSTIHQTVHAGVQTPVYIQTLTNAVCMLHSVGASDPKNALTVYTDDRDIVLFYTKLGTVDSVDDLALDCIGDDGNGPLASYHINLRAVPQTEVTTSDTAWLAGVPHQGVQIPALTGDPMQVSQEALRVGGYPSRPDPVQSPGRYEKWLEFVSKPWTVIPIRHVAKGQGRSQAASAAFTFTPNYIDDHRLPIYDDGVNYSWSGFILQEYVTCGSTRMNQPTYDYVTGEFDVPYTGDPLTLSGSHIYAMSEWVGLGGNFNNSALAQAGLDIWDTCTTSSCNATYSVWDEFTPDGLNTRFTGVEAGDLIAVSVQMVNSSGQPSPLGPYAQIGINVPNRGWCLGSCQGEIITNSTQSGFTGDGAEWIIERIAYTGCGNYTDLVNYGDTSMTYAFAEVNGCPYELDYLQNNNYTAQSAMQSCTEGTSHILSTVSQGRRDYYGADMSFTWHYYNDTN